MLGDYHSAPGRFLWIKKKSYSLTCLAVGILCCSFCGILHQQPRLCTVVGTNFL